MTNKRTSFLDLEETHYAPEKVEEGINLLWDEHKIYVADSKSSLKPYSIVIPPPNVTGRLHMGHALNNTIQDVLVRFKRMDGFNVLWVPGTDHAGIATQSVVKKQLDAEGVNWRELGREKMIERIWSWKEKYGDQILLQLRKLGCSCDWTRTRFTMDEGLSRAVRVAFKEMYDAGLIYRGKYIVNWCPVDRTALSDDEVETKDGGEPGALWHFQYPLKDGSGHITVATTRPETVLGDSAVAVHPSDERYKSLVGKMLLLPLVDREIPVIADEYVDPEFGSGCVKITPAHDPNDFQVGLRHNLEQINVMNEDATMNNSVPERFQGLDRFECRKRIVQEFSSLGLLEKIEERNTPVGRSYRSKAIIEYRLSDQWFVKMKPLADKALEASDKKEVEFFPERWDAFYRNWLGNIRDWCISRQLWWGHRIPAWYHKETGEILVDVETPKKVLEDPEAWAQDDDVLDTWFSSALWPYSTLGWPEQSDDLKTYYPTSVLVTGKDIIFFWVARMVMTGLFHMKKVPFSKVLINSIICDEEGETMSKSKGNGIDPLHVIGGATLEELQSPVYEARPANMEKLLKRNEKRYPDGFRGVGADALRYTMLTSATSAQQVQLSLKKFDEAGRPIADKLWNASRLVLSLLDSVSSPSLDTASAGPSRLEDDWILGRLDRMIARVRESFESYNFHHATDAFYHFFWDDFCDWYLEIAKVRVREKDEADRTRVALTLVECLSNFLCTLHPVMPFITEEIWGHITNVEGLQKLLPTDLVGKNVLALAPYPKNLGRYNVDGDVQFGLIQDVVRSLRNERAGAQIAPKVPLEVALRPENPEVRDVLTKGSAIISHLGGLKEFTLVDTSPNGFSLTVIEGVQIFLNLIEHMDFEAELARNEKAILKVDAEIEQIDKLLLNENFVARAPEAVVKGEQAKRDDAKERREKLHLAKAEIMALQGAQKR